jgi:hypothetical protein
MLKLKFYLENAFLSSLIGLAFYVVDFIVWVANHSFHKAVLILNHPLSLFYSILFAMAIGAIIGTVSFFFIFQIFSKLSHRAWLGFLANFWVVALMNMGGELWVEDGGNCRLFIRNFFHSQWFLALIVSEVLSLLITFMWRRRIMAYKQKLEEKKAWLKSQGDY